MTRLLGQNIGLFIISLVLAFFFWAIATETEDPTQQGQFSLSLPIETVNLDDTMLAYELSVSRARVELRAPESVWRTLTLEDMRAYIDLANINTGTLSVPIHVDVQVMPVQVLKIIPPELSLTVEQIAEKEVTVTVRIEGTTPFGYKADVPKVIPQTVRVRGPASAVARVTQAQIKVNIQGQQSDVRGDYSPVLLDQNEHPASYVEAIPKVVTVNVPISQLGYVRDLAVTVAWQGQPASGYRIANLVVDPQIVKVFGRDELVRAVPGYLQTQPVSLEALTQSLTTTVALQMPEGLSLISPPRPYVTVSLTIEPIQSGLTLAVTPTIHGLAAEMRATVSVDSVVLILNGPLAVMERLQGTDVSVVLNLTNLLPGDYKIIPVVTVPQGVTIQNVIPEAIPVRIERFVPSVLPYR